MISSLLSLLLFETVHPSNMLLATLLPPEIHVSAPALNSTNAPVKIGDSVAPALEASSVFAIDMNSGEPLYVHNIFERRQIASITKLMTAIVILDNHALDEVITVSQNAATTEGSRMFLRAGEKISVEGALRGLLINSGNDAAVALAEFDAGSVDAFVKKMNTKAHNVGLADTHFANPMGFDDPENYSTAFDVMKLGRIAINYEFIQETVQKSKDEVRAHDNAYTHNLESTNQLLNDEHFQVIGIKTGRTEGAGESLLALTKAENGHEILTVMLHSPARFRETRILLDWIFRNYTFGS